MGGGQEGGCRGRDGRIEREGEGSCERGNENYYGISVDCGVLIYYQISPIRLGNT